jgi:hypothetical protein
MGECGKAALGISTSDWQLGEYAQVAYKVLGSHISPGLSLNSPGSFKFRFGSSCWTLAGHILNNGPTV